MSSMSSVSPASPEYGREYKIYNVADYPDAPSPPMSPREEGPGRLDIDAAHQRWERVASTISPGECDLDNSKCGEDACPCFDLFFRTFDVDPGAYDLKKLATVLPVCDRKNICLHILHFSVMSGLAETSVLPVWEGVYMAEANFQQLFESLKSSVVEDQDVYIRNAIDAALEDLTNASRWKTLHFLECLFLASIHAGEGAYAECKTAGGFIRDSVDCCVCLDPFNTSDRVPLVGRCGHSWCSSCLDLVGTDCPLCREPLGTDKYAVNFSLKEAVLCLEDIKASSVLASSLSSSSSSSSSSPSSASASSSSSSFFSPPPTKKRKPTAQEAYSPSHKLRKSERPAQQRAFWPFM